MFKKLVFALLVFALSACGGSSGGSAKVRIVHASPDAPNVDVLVDGVVVLTDVPFRAVSAFLDVNDGLRNFKVNVTGTDTSAIDADATVLSGVRYSIIASNLVASINPIITVDDTEAPAAGNIKLRVIHGAPSAPEVDVYVTAVDADLASSEPVLLNVPFGVVSDFLEIPAGTYQVRVTVAGTQTVAIDTGALTFAEGSVSTAIAVDAVGGGAPFDALLLDDLA